MTDAASEAGSQILTAAWVAPICRPVFRDGAVAIRDGRLAAVGSLAEALQACPDAERTDLGEAVMLPALVNAHAHLELTLVPRPPTIRSLSHWLLEVMAAAPADGAPLREAVAAGVRQCIASGVGTVGDISTRPQQVRASLQDGPIRSVSFGEVRAMGQRRRLLQPRLDAAIDSSFASPYVVTGISPHAPYSVEMAGYVACVEAARTHRLPLATHLAESAEEAEFLAHHTGPLRELWDAIGGWDDQIPRFEGGPIRFARETGVLSHRPTALAHVNYVDDDELAILSRSSASVVFCPRTHAYFGHPPHRWQQMLAMGINVALGTDSAASSGDLNLLEDLRLFHRQAPQVAVEMLWQLVTNNAARALGVEHRVGTIEPGRQADLVCFKVKGTDPLAWIMEGNASPHGMWIDGRRAS